MCKFATHSSFAQRFMKQQIIRASRIDADLARFIREVSYDNLFVFCDENTHKHCFPLIQHIPEVYQAKQFTIPSGDENKKLKTLTKVWQFLSENGASRQSLILNLGGGMLTDLVGFAASTFKRGVRFINIPTTLLGAVDAAVGGKTGINFNGLKNEIGAFAPAIAVFIDAKFFVSLDPINLLSGYAEMLKHALLESDDELNKTLAFNLEDVDYDALNDLLFKSVLLKERIVTEDPQERGIRKALNLGHTFGHAFESLSYEKNRPLPHGYAVAWGIICELYLSYIRFGFDKGTLSKIIYFIKDNYGTCPIDCSDYDSLYELMRHDKKNEADTINFTLLRGVGEVEINQTASKSEIIEALDFLVS
ncbi:3-dehydroquinate synthase [Dysgonomonadaceae bacterium PH5-43]|nr:3-dehydroquinate synthase [Dysgonomonadaceae bacterium PH5-43]